MVVRNPVDPVSLLLFLAAGGGVFYTAGRVGALPKEFMPIWADLFNKGKVPASSGSGSGSRPPTIASRPPAPAPPSQGGSGQQVSGGGSANLGTVIAGGAAAVAGFVAGIGGTLTPAPSPDAPAPSQLPPASQDDSGARGPGMYLDFWADRYEYPAGEPVVLYGSLYIVGTGGGKIGIPGAVIDIYDEDAGQAWLHARTGLDGSWSVRYHGADTEPWRSRAMFGGWDAPVPGLALVAGLLFPTIGVQFHSVEIGGQITGPLWFYPRVAVPPAEPWSGDPTLPDPAYGPAEPTWLATLQSDRAAMDGAWAEHGAYVAAQNSELAQGFSDHWNKLDAQIREMERGQAGSYDSQVLHDWALWYVDAVQPYVDAPDWGGVITV